MRASLISVAVLSIASLGCGSGDSPANPDANVTDGGWDGAADADAGDTGPSTPRDAGATDALIDATPLLGPPYPVVLAHGFFGFDDFAGAGFLTYFFEVEEDLKATGEPLVFVTTVDPFNDSTTRGNQLVTRIEEILAMTGHAKVNIIGHSQGRLDARVVAFERPELVASITTVATPHQGSPLADILVGLVEDDRFGRLLDRFVRLIGAPLFDEVGQETSVVQSLRQLTSAGADMFNLRYSNPAGIPIFSIAGRSDRHRGGSACDAPAAPSFITQWDGENDPIDPLLSLPEEILDGGITAPFPNDGLVRVDDSKRGTFIGCLPADHLDQVGQLLGDNPGLFNAFDHKVFYQGLVAWLRAQGL